MKYLFVIMGSLVIILLFGYFFGVQEASENLVIAENSNVNTDVFGDLHQIEN